MASSLSQLAGFSATPEVLDHQSLEAARRAVELDPMDADDHAVLGEGLGRAGEFAEAEATLERAVALNPSSADVLARYSGWAPRFDKPEQGADAADRARLLNPSWPNWYNMYLCREYFFAGRYADALALVQRKPAGSVHLQDMVYAAGSAAMLGNALRTQLWRDRALANLPELMAEWHLRAAGTAIAHTNPPASCRGDGQGRVPPLRHLRTGSSFGDLAAAAGMRRGAIPRDKHPMTTRPSQLADVEEARSAGRWPRWSRHYGVRAC